MTPISTVRGLGWWGDAEGLEALFGLQGAAAAFVNSPLNYARVQVRILRAFRGSSPQHRTYVFHQQNCGPQKLTAVPAACKGSSYRTVQVLLQSLLTAKQHMESKRICCGLTGELQVPS